MQKDAISIQILGSSPSKLTQYSSQISTLINKEVTTLLFDNSMQGLPYKDRIAPNLLILLLDDITIEALNQLSALPSAIRPALLVIAADNDKQQMRLAMQAGARDFFTTSVDDQDLHKSLNQIIFDLRRSQSKQGTLTTVINSKGGAGASFIACNLAHISAVLSNCSVVLIDFDLQFGTQSLNLDLKPQHTIVEALNDATQLDFDAINGYMAVHKSGLGLLATSLEQLILSSEVSANNLNQLISLAISHYDWIFIDLPRDINHLSATLLERSDQVVIIVQQTLAHLRDAKRLTRILKSEFNIAEKNILIVVNRYQGNASLELNDIQAAIEASMIYTIPNDYDIVAKSINLGIPLYDYARNSVITKAIISLAEALNVPVRNEFKNKGFFKKFFSSKDK